ncbi:MAG: hypothetical protein QOD49_720 [Actinomycetota bacterium]|jgi:hypothetical protein|nr:hypothetical protein [Actinomycetota bacterium]
MFQRQWQGGPWALGDSGAPMFIWASPTSITAAGQWVGSDGGGNGTWSTIFDITSNLGVGLVTCGC